MAPPPRPGPLLPFGRPEGARFGVAGADSSTVPFEQIGQSAVKRLCLQNSELIDRDYPWRLRCPAWRGQEPHRARQCQYQAVLTAIVSDLHLGSHSKRDVLRTGAGRDALLAGIAEADRLVLLGDVLELREGPLREALEASRPFFGALNEACAGKQVTLLAGNHDHQLASALLDERRLDGRRPLALDERADPPDNGPLGRIAGWLAGVELELRYPGVWLRDDVYATHGHYMDVHNTVPTFERLGAAVAERLIGGLPSGPRTPDHYESVLTPIYSMAFSLAQSGGGRLAGGATSVGLWQRLNREGGGLGAQVLGGALVPAGVALLNRALPGDFRADLSGAELRRAALRGMGETVRRLGIEAEHVIFGHTHRAGPFAGEEGWKVEGSRTQLTNSGSWIWEPAFADSPRSPYFPGAIVYVDDEGPPRLERLLDELPEGLG
jgi:hypothetical protein